MNSVPRWVKVSEVLRYARDPDLTSLYLDNHRNYHQLTAAPGRLDPRLLLESGISQPAQVRGADGPRRGVIAIRSSPWKAGHDTNPWHDGSTSITVTSATTVIINLPPAACLEPPAAIRSFLMPGALTRALSAPSGLPRHR